jgi:hypothetical protein
MQGDAALPYSLNTAGRDDADRAIAASRASEESSLHGR